MQKAGCLLGLVLLVSITASAQTMESKFDVSLGYSFLNHQSLLGFSPVSGTAIGTTGDHGYDLRFTYNLTRALGLEVDLAGNHGGSVPFSSTETIPTGFGSAATTTVVTSHLNQDTLTFLFGPKLTHPFGNFQLYTHFLVGGAHGHEGVSETSTVTIPINAIATGRPNVATTTVSSGSVSEKGTAFGFEAGGGVDWVRGRWGWKILEIDYVQVTANGATSTVGPQFGVCTPASSNFCGRNQTLSTATGTAPAIAHDVRLATGIVLRFGSR